jgi:type IV secretory pathway TrbD component
MKLTLLKIPILALYVASVMMVLATPELISGAARLFVLFVLAYCGIIVLAHLVATLRTFYIWCAAAKHSREESFTAPAVVFETETEAT